VKEWGAMDEDSSKNEEEELISERRIGKGMTWTRTLTINLEVESNTYHKSLGRPGRDLPSAARQRRRRLAHRCIVPDFPAYF